MSTSWCGLDGCESVAAQHWHGQLNDVSDAVADDGNDNVGGGGGDDGGGNAELPPMMFDGGWEHGGWAHGEWAHGEWAHGEWAPREMEPHELGPGGDGDEHRDLPGPLRPGPKGW